MAATILPQIQPQSSSLESPISEPTPTEAPAGLLSRTWVPPPRPKPGRKPATDTPPSKRKAQNRLAQRNFRERRAAKVNELEDQMKELQAEHDAEIEELHAGSKQLKNHLALLESTLQADRSTLQTLQSELERERIARQTLESKLARAEAELAKAGVVPLAWNARAKGQVNGNATKAESLLQGSPQGTDLPKRSSSPRTYSTNKRPRTEGRLNSNESMEIDLTTRPKGSPRNMTVESSGIMATSDIPLDSCGFCDSNPEVCVCRGKVNEAGEADIDDADIPASPVATRPSGCTGRPGSCKQCQDDPRSARFCKSFASTHTPPNRPSENARGSGCGVANCCQVQQPTSHMRTGSLSEKFQALNASGGNAGGMTLDCAAAYRKLQLHPKFDEAMAHVDDWSAQLRPPNSRPEMTRKESLEGRTPYEIEAASVMSTLKYFDSKFGSDARSDWRNQK